MQSVLPVIGRKDTPEATTGLLHWSPATPDELADSTT
jgi:hypothetical protein